MDFTVFAAKMLERFPNAIVTYGKGAQVFGIHLSGDSAQRPPGALIVTQCDNAAGAPSELAVVCGCPTGGSFGSNTIALECDVDEAYQAACEVFFEETKLAHGLSELLSAFSMDSGAKAIVKLLSRLTGYPAVLLDSHFLVRCTSNHSDDGEFAFRTFSFVSEVGRLRYDDAQQLLLKDSFVTPVRLNDKILGYLLLLNVSSPVAFFESELALNAARLIGRSMPSAGSPSSSTSSGDAILLELLNTKHPDMDLRLRMRGAGLRFDQPKRIVVFDSGGNDLLYSDIRARLPGCCATRFKNAYVLLLDVQEGEGWKELREIIADITLMHSLNAGVSDVFTGSRQIGEQCRNAFQAIAFAERFHLEGVPAYYDDYRFFDLLSVFEQPRELFRYMHPALQKLRTIDAKGGTAYFHTLNSFLKNNASLSQTAKELLIHRNTLNYRLKRIEELSGLNFEDPNTLFSLYYSFHIAEFLGIVEF